MKEYAIYLRDVFMKTMKENPLQEFQDEYYINKLFDKYTWIDMWPHGTNKDKVIKEIIASLELEEIIEVYSSNVLAL